MDIVVKGRKVDVSEKFRAHAAEKLPKVERFDHRIIRVEVEVCEEHNPRQSDVKERVEVTCVSKGPAIRAEAAAADLYAALDMALDRLAGRLRRAADKRHGHNSHARTPASNVSADGHVPADSADVDAYADTVAFREPGRIVRDKTFASEPMTVDQALHQMELVGHDFYLFTDADTGLASVVYRRKGYDYGVIRVQALTPASATG